MLAARAVALACALVGSAAYTVVPDTAINLVGDSSDAANRMEMRKAEMAKMQEARLAEREKMKAQKEEMRAAEKARKQLQKTGGSVAPSPAPEEKEDKAASAYENDPKHSAKWNAKRKKEMKLASKHSDAWNAKHAAEKEAASAPPYDSKHSATWNAAHGHAAATAPKAVSLVGESSDAANRMAMRKAEMAKMQRKLDASVAKRVQEPT